jgi:hypothetical protein
MSDGYDSGYEPHYDGGEATHVDADQEAYNLDHGAAEYGHNEDHSLDHQAYGQADSHEADQHYNHGEAEHYHSPAGSEYDRAEYTNYDAHEADSHAAFGESLSEHDSSSEFANIEHLQESLEASHFDATHIEVPGYQGPELEGGGEQHLSAVDK